MATTDRTTAAPNHPDACWRAVVKCDVRADGSFVYAVRTTGIFCRPSCPARKPRRDNVDFFESATEARAEGYRACKRCRPLLEATPDARASRIADACRAIDAAAPGRLDVAALARAAGWSPSHFQRTFKRLTGLTPTGYAKSARGDRMRRALATNDTVTGAIYEAGYESTGRFYEDVDAHLAMSPTEFRRGAKGIDIRFAIGSSALGEILVATTLRGVCAIFLGDDADELIHDLEARFTQARLSVGDEVFERQVATVISALERSQPIGLPLDLRGTAFQRRVWEALRTIPAGATATYSEIAERICAPRSARAVAGACASNPLAIAIPCHRVVRRDGSLSGYRWGVERKRTLLAREVGGDSCDSLGTRST